MADRGGFIALWRSALDSWLFELPDLQFKIALRLLLEANWKPTTVYRRGQRVVIGRGQLIMSQPGLAKRSGCSRGAVRRTLSNLEKVGFLSQDTSQGVTLVTILNYERYQDKPTGASQESSQWRANGEPMASQIITREQGNKGTREEKGDFGQGTLFADGGEPDPPVNGHRVKRIHGVPEPEALEAADEVVGAFNRSFRRNLGARSWIKPIARAIAAGYTVAELRGAVWWAANEWANDDEQRRARDPGTIVKLQSSQGYRCLPQYLSLADELWREAKQGPAPWWVDGQPRKDRP